MIKFFIIILSIAVPFNAFESFYWLDNDWTNDNVKELFILNEISIDFTKPENVTTFRVFFKDKVPLYFFIESYIDVLKWQVEPKLGWNEYSVVARTENISLFQNLSFVKSTNGFIVERIFVRNYEFATNWTIKYDGTKWSELPTGQYKSQLILPIATPGFEYFNINVQLGENCELLIDYSGENYIYSTETSKLFRLNTENNTILEFTRRVHDVNKPHGVWKIEYYFSSVQEKHIPSISIKNSAESENLHFLYYLSKVLSYALGPINLI